MTMPDNRELVRTFAEEGLSSLKGAHPGITGTRAERELEDRFDRWERQALRKAERMSPLKEEYRRLENSVFDHDAGLATIESISDDAGAFAESAKVAVEPVPDTDDPVVLEEYHSDLLAGWREVLDQKTIEWTMTLLEKERSRLIDSLEAWLRVVEAASETEESMGLGTGTLWDLSSESNTVQDASVIRKWSESFRNDPNVRRLCEILGRSLSISRDRETDREVQTNDRRSIPDYSSKEEIVGLELGRSLADMVPSETGLLNDPDLEILFDLKYMENRLSCFSKEGSLSVEGERMENVDAIDEERMSGPVVLCIDTSGSMDGTPEYIAKALAFYVVMAASSRKRRCYLINFSVDTDVLDLTPPRGLAELLSFLEVGFHGGTDVVPAIRKAVDQVLYEEYRMADVLVISDFVVPPDAFDGVGKQVAEAKGRGCRFHSLSIGNFMFRPDLSRVFDECWHYEPATGCVSNADD